MIELAIAAAAGAVLIAIVWWYDSRGPSEWEDLLSPEARQAHDFLRQKFEAEERVAMWSSSAAAAVGAAFAAGVATERLQLLRRLGLYARIIAAAAPPPRRIRVRLEILREGFAAVARGGGDFASLQVLDEQTLESFQTLASAAGRMRR